MTRRVDPQEVARELGDQELMPERIGHVNRKEPVHLAAQHRRKRRTRKGRRPR